MLPVLQFIIPVVLFSIFMIFIGSMYSNKDQSSNKLQPAGPPSEEELPSPQDIHSPDDLSNEEADAIIGGGFDDLEQEFQEIMSEDEGEELRDPEEVKVQLLATLVKYLCWKTYQGDLEWDKKLNRGYYATSGKVPPISHHSQEQLRVNLNYEMNLGYAKGYLRIYNSHSDTIIRENLIEVLGEEPYEELEKWAENSNSLPSNMRHSLKELQKEVSS
jgi:hypothetical protein